MSIESWFKRSWYGNTGWTKIFTPLLPLVNRLVSQKRASFLDQSKPSYNPPIPVIVVGNISVGGTGKSPMVIALCELLAQNGYNPGIISRGYGAKIDSPTFVYKDSLTSEVGDEPVMLARRTRCPIVVYSKRVAAAKKLIAETDIDIIISDDGMQHYALGRDIEIAMLDSGRGVGNGKLLPVGPLREPVERLGEVDFIVSIADVMTPGLAALRHPVVLASLVPEDLRSLDGKRCLPLNEASLPEKKWHIMAGIGNPDRFVSLLKKVGIDDKSSHWFRDHHDFSVTDVPQKQPVIMTEKDAVKCQFLPIVNSDVWYLPVSLMLPDKFKQAFLGKLDTVKKKRVRNE